MNNRRKYSLVLDFLYVVGVAPGRQQGMVCNRATRSHIEEIYSPASTILTDHARCSYLHHDRERPPTKSTFLARSAN